MDKKTLLRTAINNHSQFSPNQKEILNILIDLSIDNKVIVDINDIIKLSKSTRATVSTAIAFFNNSGIIGNTNLNGKKFTGCQINQEKLNEIISHYTKKTELAKK